MEILIKEQELLANDLEMYLIPSKEEYVVSVAKNLDIANISKKEMQTTAKTIVHEAKESGFSLEVYVYAKKMAEFSKQLIDSLKDDVSSDLKLGRGEKDHLFNCEISEKMQGVKYDFSTCEDSHYNDLKSKFDELKYDLSEREKFLKTVTKKITIVNEDTGEVEEIKPPVKTGKLGVEIIIK